MTNPFWAMLYYVARRFGPPRPQPSQPQPSPRQPQTGTSAPEELPEMSFLMVAINRMIAAREREQQRRQLVAEAEKMMQDYADRKLRSAQRRLEIDGKTLDFTSAPAFDITPAEAAEPVVNRFKAKRIMSIKMNNTSPV